RILVMLVVATLGASLGSFTARLSSLPGFARAAQMFQARFGLSFGTVAAGQVTAVTVSASSVTLAMAPGMAMSSISAGVGEGRRRRGKTPAPENYRGRFNAARAAQGRPRLPDDWDAHHRIPQEYRSHPEFRGFDFDAPENVQGVKGARSDVNIHQEITEQWA